MALPQLTYLHVMTIVWTLVTISSTSTKNYYCIHGTHNYVDLTKYDTATITTRAQNEMTYGNDKYCSWGVWANDSKRIAVNVVTSDIGTVPPGGDCYDYTYSAVKQVEIMDDFNWLKADPGLYYRICGSSYPIQFTSQHQQLIIEFASKTNTGNYKGIEFHVTSFDAGTCLSGMNIAERNNYCYHIFGNSVSWEEAQEICTIQQGNLVTFQDQAEADFVKSHVMNYNMSSINELSVGLYRLEKKYTYTWIDKTNGTYTIPSHLSSASNTSAQCITMALNGSLSITECSTMKYPFICKSKKDGKSKLYKAPMTATTSSSISSTSNVMLSVMILGLILSLLYSNL